MTRHTPWLLLGSRSRLALAAEVRPATAAPAGSRQAKDCP